MPNSVVCAIPRGITHDDARNTFNQIRKEMPGLTPAQLRREAARRMNTDYDTFLKAWKKPTKAPLIPSPAPTVLDVVKTDVIKKEPYTPFNISSFSSNLRSSTKMSQAIKRNGQTIGYIQKAEQGYWEMGPTNYRTGRFIIEKRGYVALDTRGSVIKEGYSALMRSADEALDVVKRKAVVPTPRPLPIPDPVPKVIRTPTTPPSTSLTYDRARAEFKAVKRENPDFTDAMARREAAKRLDTDYDTYLRAWKKPKTAPALRPETRHSVAPKTRVPKDEPFTDNNLIFPKKKPDGHTPVGGVDDIAEDLDVVNPEYGISGSTENCTSCTTAYEMRRRGYEVQSRLMGHGQPLEDIYRSWGIGPENQIFGVDYNPYMSGQYPRRVHRLIWEQKADLLPNGARGFISVEWKRGGAHILNWEKRNGKIYYLDAQSQSEFVGKYKWDKVDESRLSVVRIDNVKASNNLEWLLGNGADDQIMTTNPYKYDHTKRSQRLNRRLRAKR